MKILHTSDWHLGRNLYDKKRYDEFEEFLNWLAKFISENGIDALLVAGDIFDTSTPSNRAQEIYYRFLTSITKTCCRHIVITGGNHDSPSFLNAPKALLGALNIRVVGSVSDLIRDEIFVLKNTAGDPEAIICAVPFLRDRDVRTVESGETPDAKLQNLLDGIADHYNNVLESAREIKSTIKNANVPIIGMGHLFTRNAATIEGDGVRELYIGSMAHIDADLIADGFDYMALGHLHLAQKAGNSGKVWYSGSPLPMGFNEAGSPKKVIVVEFGNETKEFCDITLHEVPKFRELGSLKGTLDEVSEKLKKIIAKGVRIWLEVELDDIVSPLRIRERFDELLEDTNAEILRIRNRKIAEQALSVKGDNASLETLSDEVVFMHCLDANQVTEEKKKELILLYREAIALLEESESAVIE